MSTLGAEIRHARRRLGMSQRELAAAAGVSYQMVGKLERGQVDARVSSVAALASALGLTLRLGREQAATRRPSGKLVAPLEVDPRRADPDVLRARFPAVDGFNDRGFMGAALQWLRDAIADGREPPVQGPLRDVWYRYLKPVASRLGLKDGYVTTSRVLADLVLAHRVMTYGDLGLTDLGWEERRIGGRRAHVVVYAEQVGWFRALRDVHDEHGVTVTCWEGQPKGINCEYTARHVLEALEGRVGVRLIGLTDYDPAGDIIMKAFARNLERYGLIVERNVRVVRPSLFTSDQRRRLAYPLNRGRGADTRAREWMQRRGGVDGEPLGLPSLPLGWAGVERVVTHLIEELDDV